MSSRERSWTHGCESSEEARRPSTRPTCRAWSSRATASSAPRRTSCWRSPTRRARAVVARRRAARGHARRGAAPGRCAEPRAARLRARRSSACRRCTISGFSLEFLEGMTSAHRSRLLGDEGAAAPAHWSWGAPDGPEVDATPARLRERRGGARAGQLERHRTGLAEAGLREIATLDTEDIGRGEHFGFRDGLSQPAMSGVGRRGPAMHTVEPGEFLLGYVNEHGQYPRSPLVPAPRTPAACCRRVPRRPAGAVAPVPPGLEDAHDFGRNGSYLVVRTLVQDVGGLLGLRRPGDPRPDGAVRRGRAHGAGRPDGRALAERCADDALSRGGPARAGRGQRLRLRRRRPLTGLRCPIGAHVRRTNPRDSLPPSRGRTTRSTSASGIG